MHSVKLSRNAVRSSMRRVSRSCHARDNRAQSSVVGTRLSGNESNASLISSSDTPTPARP
ncbi:hypothetical protein NJ76_04285 [Rhodococcus sp. IITR03]|nr:hypothetical protein NJ76_04285 [Rhodococcus sp. IITR03]